MLAEHVNVEFKNFEPTIDLRRNVYYLLNRMHFKTPSQSIISATFSMTNGLLEGVIKVSSTAENFVVRATGVEWPELGQSLFEKMGERLEKWKSLRFD